MNYLEDTLKRRVVFFTGKGGVGKSTVAWATAIACHKKGRKVAVASWNPYPWKIHKEIYPEIPCILLETFSAFREYVHKIFRFEGVYKVVFDNHIFRTFVKAAPGLSETVIAGKLSHHFFTEPERLLLVDLPSSGHALTFFKSPKGIQSLFKAGFVHAQANEIIEMFESPLTRIDLVTLAEELPVVETQSLVDSLKPLYSFHLGYFHWNRMTPIWNVPLSLSNASASFNKFLKAYHEKIQYEKTLQSELLSAEMPFIQIPEFALDSSAQLLEQVAEVLTHHE